MHTVSTVLIPPAVGTCLSGLISSALTQGFLLRIVPARDRPSLSLHSCFGGLCPLSSVVHSTILLTRFTVPCFSIWGIRTSGQELLGAELCRVGVLVRNMHHICMGRGREGPFCVKAKGGPGHWMVRRQEQVPTAQQQQMAQRTELRSQVWSWQGGSCIALVTVTGSMFLSPQCRKLLASGPSQLAIWFLAVILQPLWDRAAVSLLCTR